MSGSGRSASTGNIKNKIKRSEIYQKQRHAKAKAKSERREKRKREEDDAEGAPPKQKPKTLDNTREADDTVVAPDDEEVRTDEATDEFAEYFSGAKTPKIMVTTKRRPSGKIFPLIAEFLTILPNSFYYKRGNYEIGKICGYAANRGFTHLIVLSERMKKPNGLIISHLPEGPTAAFRLSSTMSALDVPNHGTPTSHIPEIILSGFTTRLGRRAGRLFGSLFPHNPEFQGRRVCTFHNQRDFIFFRQHRYEFAQTGSGSSSSSGGGSGAKAAAAAAAAEGKPVPGMKARLQELGPRFTLKLKWVLAGTFDPLHGDYEWVHKRKLQDTSRRKFHL